jgi:vacuolar-type H+-ATPase subunit H
MSGVSADVKEPADDDLAAIYTGGENFMARMQAIAKLRDDQRAAYINLKVGIDAKTALDTAKAHQSDAEADRRKAAEELSAARAAARGIVDKARQEASRMLGEASRRSSEAQDRARTVIEGADRHLEDARNKAADVLAEAKAVSDGIQAKWHEAHSAHQEHLKVKDEHEQAKMEHLSSAEVYRRKAAVLTKALAEAALIK